jgi:transcriptional regulator with XRE-family HTH domain
MRLRSAETLRALMRQQRLSLGALATAAQCSKSFVSHLLSGRRSTCTDDLATRIASALEVPVHVLFAPAKSISDRRADAHRLPLATGVPDRGHHYSNRLEGRQARPLITEPNARLVSRCGWVPQRVLLGDRGTAVGWRTMSLHRHPPGSAAGATPGTTSALPEVSARCSFAAERH